MPGYLLAIIINIIIIIIINIVITISAITRPGYSNSQIASDVIGISVKYDDNEDATISNKVSTKITITFNHTASLTVS